MNDVWNLKGELFVTLLDASGNVKDTEHIENLIVTVGKVHVMDQLLTSPSDGTMTHMAVGTGVVGALVGDTALGSELTRKVFGSKTQGTAPNNNQITYENTWGSGEAIGAITEAGIFNASSGGTMLNRATFAVKNKESSDTLIITWIVTLP